MFFLIDLMIQFVVWIYYGYEECLGHCLESRKGVTAMGHSLSSTGCSFQPESMASCS